MRARDGVTSIILLRTVGLALTGGARGETESAGGLVEGLLSSNLVDNDVQVVQLIVKSDIFIEGENMGKFFFQARGELGGK